jgi:hypothetical protein
MKPDARSPVPDVPADAVVACLERTRSAVANVLVAAGVGVAVSWLLLRWRDGWATPAASETLRRSLLIALVILVVVSYAVRRVLAGRQALREPSVRARRFYLGHVVAAAVAALTVPLGLAFGWFVRPRLDAVAPFWVAALALGFLSLPRASELDGFDEPLPGPGSSPVRPASSEANA